MARTRKTPGEALVEQGWAVHAWAVGLEPEAFARPSVLPGWDARALLAHVEQLLDGMLTVLARPTWEVPLANAVLVGRYAEAAGQMSGRVLDHAVAYAPAALLERLAATLDRVGEVLASPEPPPAAVSSARGPVTPADFVASRVVELVEPGVHRPALLDEGLARRLPRPHHDAILVVGSSAGPANASHGRRTSVRSRP